MMGLHYNPARHVITNVPLLGWLQREFPDRPLFIYRHVKTGNFVISEWLSKDRGLAMEHWLLGPSPDNFDREAAQLLRQYLLAPIPNKKITEMALTAEQQLDQDYMTAQEEIYTNLRHIRKAQMVVPCLAVWRLGDYMLCLKPGFYLGTISNVRDMLDEPDTNAKWTDAKIIKYIESVYAMVFSDLNRGQQDPILIPYDVTSTTNSADKWYELPPIIGAIPRLSMLDSSGNLLAHIKCNSMWNPYGQGIKVMNNHLFIKEGAVATNNQIRIEFVPSGTAHLHDGQVTNNIGAAARTAHATYCTTTVIVILDNDYTAEFPVDSWIENSTDSAWHQVSAVSLGDGGDGDGNDDTIITMSTTATTSWDGLSVQAFYNDRLVLDATPSTGTLDNRLQAYAGSILRILGSDAGHNFVADRIIDTYSNATRVATILVDWQTGPSGNVDYEIAPLLDRVLEMPISMYAAKIIAGIEGDRRRVASVTDNYRDMMRSLRLNFVNYHSYMTSIFRGDTPHNPQY